MPVLLIENEFCFSRLQILQTGYCTHFFYFGRLPLRNHHVFAQALTVNKEMFCKYETDFYISRSVTHLQCCVFSIPIRILTIQTDLGRTVSRMLLRSSSCNPKGLIAFSRLNNKYHQSSTPIHGWSRNFYFTAACPYPDESDRCLRFMLAKQREPDNVYSRTRRIALRFFVKI